MIFKAINRCTTPQQDAAHSGGKSCQIPATHSNLMEGRDQSTKKLRNQF
jgi:hypothetical protein